MCESKKKNVKSKGKLFINPFRHPSQELPAPEAVPASRNESVAIIITELQRNHH